MSDHLFTLIKKSNILLFNQYPTITYLTLGEHNWRAAKTAGLGEKATALNAKVALGVLTNKFISHSNKRI